MTYCSNDIEAVDGIILSRRKVGIMPRISPYAITLSGKDRDELECIARRYTSPYRDVVRAKIVLMAAEGMTNQQIADRLDMPRQIVSRWRKRFFEQGMSGLEERPRGGRPSVFSPSGGRGGEGAGV